ncbi:MAG: cell division protein SepF [Frankiales bacterium]|nr:cell division protein SepF [Frankiales bacterium]
MPGAMRKLGLYLGLVEDDEGARDARDRRYADDAYDEDELDHDEPAPAVARRWTPSDDDPVRGARQAPARTAALRTADLRRTPDEPASRSRGSVALDPAGRPAAVPAVTEAYRITTLHPRTYNEARTIGEHFRQGTPVIMNLTEMDDVDAKRLVDFAAGLIFGLRGSIERVTNKVFLLSPEHVQVTAEDKARIAEGGFFNQS